MGNNKLASQFLSRRYRSVGKPDEDVLELKNEMAAEKRLLTAENWEEHKEQLEGRSDHLNREVDALETCIAECKEEDNFLDLKGIAYEEQSEKFQKGKLKEKPKYMCLKCFEVYPAQQISEFNKMN